VPFPTAGWGPEHDLAQALVVRVHYGKATNDVVAGAHNCFAYGSKHHSPGWNCFMARRIYGERCAVSISPTKARFRIPSAAANNSTSLPKPRARWLRILDHAIDGVVGVRRLMVKQRHAPRPSFDGDVGHVVGAAMSPAAARRVLLGRVLRILNEQVHAAHELDQATVATMNRSAAQAAPPGPVLAAA